MTGRVAYLAGLASRAASAQPPLRLQPTQAPQSLQPPRPLFAGPAYGLDSPRDSGLDRALGLGLDPAPSPGDDVRDQDGLAGASGSQTAETAPTRWAGFPPAEAAAPSPAARPGTRAHGSTPAAGAPAPEAASVNSQVPAPPPSAGPAPAENLVPTKRLAGPESRPAGTSASGTGPSWPGSPPSPATPRASAPGTGVACPASGRGAESAQVMTVGDTDGPDPDAGPPAAATLLAAGLPGGAGQRVRTGRGHWPGPCGSAARPRLAVGGAGGTARRAPRARAERAETGGGWRNGP